jgi:hypothetical protein
MELNKIILQLLKSRLGISTESKDAILYAIIDGILDECENVRGIQLEEKRYSDILLVLDWATWKYNHPDEGIMPRSIQFRIHNLMVKAVNNESNMG